MSSEWAVQTSRKSRRNNKKQQKQEQQQEKEQTVEEAQAQHEQPAAAAQASQQQHSAHEPRIGSAEVTIAPPAPVTQEIVESSHQPSKAQDDSSFTEVRSKKKNKRRKQQSEPSPVVQQQSLPKLEPVVDEPQRQAPNQSTTPVSVASGASSIGFDEGGEPGWVEVKTSKKKKQQSSNQKPLQQQQAASSSSSSSKSFGVAPSNAFSALQQLQSPAKSPRKQQQQQQPESPQQQQQKPQLSESELVREICSLVSVHPGASSSQLLNFTQDKIGQTWKKASYQKDFGKFSSFLSSHPKELTWRQADDKVFLTSQIAKLKKKQRRKAKKQQRSPSPTDNASSTDLPELEPVPQSAPVVVNRKQSKKPASKTNKKKAAVVVQQKQQQPQQEGAAPVGVLVFVVFAVVLAALVLRNAQFRALITGETAE